MIKVSIVGLVTVFFCILLRTFKSEYAVILSLGSCLLIFFLILGRLTTILEAFSKITDLIQLNGTYLGLLLKIIGIAYLGEFTSNVCKDAGCQAISGHIEMVGKITILSMSLPVFLSILNIVESFLG